MCLRACVCVSACVCVCFCLCLVTSLFLTRSLCVQVATEGIQSTPLNLALSWRGDPGSTDLRIDYKYNSHAMAAPAPLHNIHFLVPVDGGMATLQAMIPPATW